MEGKLTSLQVGEFLQDFEQHATFEIIEGAKEKNEIIKIAKAKGIDLKKNKDLLGFKCIYAFADRPNANLDYLPEKALLKALPSIIGKPVNISHDRRYVVGHILDYRYQQKEKQVMAFGVVYSSCFEDEAKMLKKDFADKKLTVSFEIFSPEKKRKIRQDGVTELYDMTMAGMALLPRDVDPAFEGANVLAIARKKMESEKDLDLVYASKYKKEDIFLADHFKDEVEKNLQKLNEEEKAKPTEVVPPKEVTEPIKPVEAPKEEITEPIKEKVEIPKEPEVITNPKIKCSNCEEELDLTITPEISLGKVKCSKCFAILNGQTGEMIYPPQIKNFRMACPACRMNNWLILGNEENKTKIKCLNESCNKTYEVAFKVEKPNELLDKMKFIYINSATCLQCGKSIPISTTSHVKNIELTCPKCGLSFVYDITKGNKDRQITKITEIIEDESSEKGGDEKVKKPDEKEKETTKVDKTEEVKVDKPKEEVKVETPKEEVKEPVKEEEKVEAPKVEEPKVKASIEIPEKSSEETQEAHVELATEIADDTITVTAGAETKSYVDIIKAENIEIAERGKGKGKGGKPQGDGGADKCVCSKCGYEASHAKGKPCTEIKCPKCGTALAGKNKSAKKPKKTKKSAVRRAVKKILTLKKEIKTAKLEKQEKEDKLKTAIKKVASQLIKAYAEIKKIKLEADEKIELYKENAKEILKRREDLGEGYGTDLSDKDILDDDKFETASLRRENVLLKASKETADDIVGEKNEEEGNDEIAKAAKVITKKAFPVKNKKRRQ